MKNNILHLTPDFNYGDGRSYYVFLLLKYFKRAGYNVFLFTNKSNSAERLEEQGIPVFKDPHLSNKSSFIKSLKYISGIVEDNGISIIHSHHRYFELLANSLNKKKLNLKTVFTALSIVDKKYYIEYRSDKIIAVSNSVKKMLLEKFNIDEKRISVIPNFADSEETDETVPGNKTDVINILSIGRFHKDKNYLTLLKAISLIKEYKIKLVLIGEGEEKENYEEIILEKSLNAELITPKRNLSVYYRNADICILTSVRDPLPGFMLQSGLNKKPFIGSNTDGIAEVIKDSFNGLLFEKRNETELSGKIRLFIEDRILANKCAENLNKEVKENYTEKAVIPQIENLYNRLFV